VERIANGIACRRFAEGPEPDAIPGFQRRDGELVIGTLAGLRAVKNLPRLVRAFAAAALPHARLVIVGEGPEREAILAEAERLGVAKQVLLPGFVADPARYVGLFDIFALSSDSEQFPISLVEAMAAGLPVAATDVGDIRAMITDENRAYLAADEAPLGHALGALARDPALRARLGAANRAKAQAEYDEGVMIDRYARLYGEAIGASDAFV
jgi:glycosyltransferase involved in cell wall biosynthesis